MESIRFTGPLRTDLGAPFQHPRRLRDAYVSRQGDVIPVNDPVWDGAIHPAAVKPFIAWNNFLLSSVDGITDAAEMARKLYALDVDGNVRIYEESYDGTIPNKASVPHVLSGRMDLDAPLRGAPDDFPEVPVDGETERNLNVYITYLLIPYDKDGHAGPPFYYPVTYQTEDASFFYEADDGSSLVCIYPRHNFRPVDFACSSDTVEVEVYRTAEMLDDFHNNKPGYFFHSTISVDETGTAHLFDDRVWYYEGFLDRYWPLEDGSNGNEPDATYVAKHLGGPAERGVMPDEPLEVEASIWAQHYANGTVNGNTFFGNNADRPTTSTDILRPAGKDNLVEMGPPEAFEAEAIFNHGGVMMYGGVTYAMPMPILTHLRPKGPEDNVAGDQIIFQYEFRMPDGSVGYGPALTVTNAQLVKIAVHGLETALRVYGLRGGSFQLIERLTPDASGEYVTGATSGQMDIFDTSQAVSSRASWTFGETGLTYAEEDPTVTDPATITEPDVVLMAKEYRPLEITFDQFRTPDREDLVALAPARIAEEESVVTYSFYAMTAENVFAIERTAERVGFRDYVMRGIGVKTSEMTGPLVAPMRSQLAMVGSDGHLYLLSGRRFQQLDLDLDLWDEIYDLAYDRDANELLLATNRGLLAYDPDVYQGFYKQIDFPGGTGVYEGDYGPVSYTRIDQSSPFMVAHLLAGVDLGGTQYDPPSLNLTAQPQNRPEWIERGEEPRLTAEVETQRILFGMPAGSIKWLKADYDPITTTVEEEPPPPPPPPPPLSILLSGTVDDAGTVTLTWTQPDPADVQANGFEYVEGYTVYSDTNSGEPYANAYSRAVDQFTDNGDGTLSDTVSGLTPGVTYYFLVAAYGPESPPEPEPPPEEPVISEEQIWLRVEDQTPSHEENYVYRVPPRRTVHPSFFSGEEHSLFLSDFAIFRQLLVDFVPE